MDNLLHILIVCSANAKDFSFDKHQVFIYEQIENIKKRFDVKYDTFFIRGKGLIGYLKSISYLRKELKRDDYSLIHAHFGLSGLVSIFQLKVPVVITYHGSDINTKMLNILSTIAGLFSQKNIFVSEKLKRDILFTNKSKTAVVPCGVDFNMFYPIKKSEARERLGWNKDSSYIVFAGSKSVPVKNYGLAYESVKITSKDIQIIVLENCSRATINLMLNACDTLLLTSKSEGSPQIIKEAMACNCPIVATDVGDIKDIITNVKGCYLASFDPKDLAEKIKMALEYSKQNMFTTGRQTIQKYEIGRISEQIFRVYTEICFQ